MVDKFRYGSCNPTELDSKSATGHPRPPRAPAGAIRRQAVNLLVVSIPTMTLEHSFRFVDLGGSSLLLQRISDRQLTSQISSRLADGAPSVGSRMPSPTGVQTLGSPRRRASRPVAARRGIRDGPNLFARTMDKEAMAIGSGVVPPPPSPASVSSVPGCSRSGISGVLADCKCSACWAA